LDPENADRKRAGSYLLEGELARGGFGVVHRARHAVSGRGAAVKVLHAGKAGEAAAISRFEREAEVVLALTHPHVVEIFEHGCLDDGRPYFAMELLEGQTVAERLAARGRLSLDEVVDIVAPLADALDAAHARGIVHRDVKPSNVFLADDRPAGRVVLLDFGVAKLRDGLHATLTGSRDALGTLAFMAPEQFLGSRVDARADVYALGALAYMMLTGQPPFAESGTRLLRQIRERAHPAPPSSRAPIDPALDAPILHALQRDVDARTASAGAFVSALREAAQAPPIAARPEGAIARPSLAIHAELRALGEEDEAQLAELESALPAVSTELAAAGLVVLRETATQLLCLGAEVGAAARRQAVAAAVTSYRRFTAGAGQRGRVALSVALHAGEIWQSPEGTLLEGGLLDVRSWVSAAPAGVMASRALLADLADLEEPGEPVPGASGFVWLAR
jgi:serine/threonine-protein kinase